MNHHFLTILQSLNATAKKASKSFLAYGFLFFISGCVYYNTFYNAQVYYRQGVKLLKTNPSLAKTHFEKSLAKSALVVKKHFHSKWADDALFLVGLSYYQLGEYEKAIKNFDDFLAVFPNSNYRDEVNYYRGLAYLANKDYGTAAMIFYDLQTNSPKFASKAVFQRAFTYFQKEEYAIAKDSLFEFVIQYPKAKERKDATFLLAEICFKLKEWNKAIGWYQEYLRRAELEPKEKAVIDLKRAECWFEQGLFDSARILLSKDYSGYPDLINQVNLLLGKVFLAQEKSESAIQYLTKVKTGNQAAEAYYLLGQKYERDQKLEKAIAYYDTANRFGSGSEFGNNAKKRQALLELLIAKANAQYSAETQFRLGELYGFALNEYEIAVKEYQKTYDSFPDSPYAPKALYAQAWLIKNRLRQTHYDTILKLLIDKYPKTVYANEARKELGLSEIKLLPEDTASSSPIKESLPSSQKPEVVNQVSLPISSKESLTEIPIKAPSSNKDSLIASSKAEKRRRRQREKANQAIIATLAESLVQKEKIIEESTPVKKLMVADTILTYELNPPIIYFDFDRYEIKSDDTITLKTFAYQLKNDSTLKIVIKGYCDPIGSEAYNYQLGWRRANSTKNFLARLGINPSRISIVSLGETHLIATDSLEYWKNRRCEFIVEIGEKNQ